jgi:hypothetical protein
MRDAGRLMWPPFVPLSIRENIQFEVGALGQNVLLRNDKTAHGKKNLGYHEKRGCY